MKRLLFFLALLFATPALASNCGGYPNTLSNGQLADANQVMANFNSILNCANTNLVSNASLAGTYAPLVSPAFTGVPTAPTASLATSTTQIATTSFVNQNLASYLTASAAASTYAPLASPTFTGVPAAPTAAPLTNSTQLATTAYTDAAVTAGTPAATTSTAGITPYATGAQVVTGTDTTHAVTPGSLTSAQTLSSTGYTKMPGGLQLEWGTSGSISGSGGSATQTMANACASAIYSIQITPVGAGGSGGQSYAYVTVLTLGTFSITNNASASLTFYWSVICK